MGVSESISLTHYQTFNMRYLLIILIVIRSFKIFVNDKWAVVW